MEYKYEIVKYNDKYPAKIFLQNKPGKRCCTSLHWHKAFEFLYIIDGNLNVKNNSTVTSLKSGDIYFINSDCFHRTFTTEPENNIKYLVVLLSYEQLLKYYPNLYRFEFNPLENDCAKCKITDLLKQVSVLFEEKTDGFEIKIHSLLLDIYYILITDCAVESSEKIQSSNNKDFEYVKSAIKFMGEKYQENITLADICSKIGLSTSYFSRCFKNITRTSVMQYLANIRLESALREIVEDNKTVTCAAFDNGFASVKSFIDLCKKVYNCTPKQYKNNYS